MSNPDAYLVSYLGIILDFIWLLLALNKCANLCIIGKQPDYLIVPSLPAVARVGTFENAVLAAVNKAEAAGLKTRVATLIDTLKPENNFFFFACQILHQRHINCHVCRC